MESVMPEWKVRHRDDRKEGRAVRRETLLCSAFSRIRCCSSFMKPPRRLRRALRVCFFGLLALFVLLAGGVWWAHRHLPRLTVEAVNRAFPELQLSAKTVAFSTTGVLDLKAIRWTDRHDGSTAVL